MDDRTLIIIGKDLVNMARDLDRSAARDRRILRAALLIEESGELLVGVGRQNKVEIADALTDIMYASLGLIVDFDLTVDDVDERRLSQVREFLAQPSLHYDGGLPKHSSPTLDSYGREVHNTALATGSSVVAQVALVCLSLSGEQVDLERRMAELLRAVTDMMGYYEFPIDELFDEVHRSNMTKTATDARVRDKGTSYEPPKIKEILDARMPNQR